MKKLIYLFVIALVAVSCNDSGNNNSQSRESFNKERMQHFYDEVFNAHNIAAIDSFCTEDFLDHNPDQKYSGKGIQDLKASLSEFFTAFPDVHIKTNFIIAQGDTVMAHITYTGTNTGSMGMPPTNKKVEIDGIDIVVIKDGKATNRWGLFDNMKMMMQLGLMPGPGEKSDNASM